MSSDYYPVIVVWRLNIWLHAQFFSGEIVIRDVRFVWRILTDAVISSLSILKMEPKLRKLIRATYLLIIIAYLEIINSRYEKIISNYCVSRDN